MSTDPSSADSLKMYAELADWWPLISAPADYAEEADFYTKALKGAGTLPAQTLLELGSGGGNNASHMKAHFDITLVEPSDGMRAVSKELNPDCEHHTGDMRTVRLGRTFDRVFIQDAICYMTTLGDLRRALETAYVHCRPGGAALFAPDALVETFRPSTDDGGHDGDGRSVRYLSWSSDPDPTDSTYTVDYAYMLREQNGSVRVVHDRHVEGLFRRDDWLGLLANVGFDAVVVPFDHSELEPGSYEVFIAVRPDSE